MIKESGKILENGRFEKTGRSLKKMGEKTEENGREN